MHGRKRGDVAAAGGPPVGVRCHRVSGAVESWSPVARTEGPRGLSIYLAKNR